MYIETPYTFIFVFFLLFFRKCFEKFYMMSLIPDISIMVRVFTSGPENMGSIPGRHIKDSKNGT